MVEKSSQCNPRGKKDNNAEICFSVFSQCFEESNWIWPWNTLSAAMCCECLCPLRIGQCIEVALRCVAVHVSFLKPPLAGAWQHQLCPERTKNTVFFLSEPAERLACGMENCWHTFKGRTKLRVAVDRKQDAHQEKAWDKEGAEEGTLSLCAACLKKNDLAALRNLLDKNKLDSHWILAL